MIVDSMQYKPGQCWCSLRSTLRRFPVTPGATTTSAGHTKPANSTSTGHATDIAYANSKGIEVGGYDLIALTRQVPVQWMAIDPNTG
ncbi:unnamed protein product [Didymodactylos carnosus]|uniref:Uncharacterized protein n=1 Tax=Didymodactylos carnosus TaxID=1234261 RepID=A0A8S2MEZ2_9BILA|nr:unnamed protein product [Didymodactylos carnosus]CAF3954922.1 unnamed protein product [Didymodactylos carnosus]